MAKEIPEKYYGEAMRELDSDPKVNLLAKCIAEEGSTDAGRAKYIAKRAKKLLYKALEKKRKENDREEEERIRQYTDLEIKREMDRLDQWLYTSCGTGEQIAGGVPECLNSMMKRKTLKTLIAEAKRRPTLKDLLKDLRRRTITNKTLESLKGVGRYDDDENGLNDWYRQEQL